MGSALGVFSLDIYFFGRPVERLLAVGRFLASTPRSVRQTMSVSEPESPSPGPVDAEGDKVLTTTGRIVSSKLQSVLNALMLAGSLCESTYMHCRPTRGLEVHIQWPCSSLLCYTGDIHTAHSGANLVLYTYIHVHWKIRITLK